MAKRRFELESGESIDQEWFAGIPSRGGRVANYGGTLVLTTNRLIWEAMRLSRRFGLDQYVGVMLEDQQAIGIDLPTIRQVRPDEKRAGILHIDTDDGTLRLIVSAARAPATGNRQARDDAVDRIRQACGITQ